MKLTTTQEKTIKKLEKALDKKAKGGEIDINYFMVLEMLKWHKRNLGK